MSDIRSLRLCYTAGYTFVGNGTNGAANAVLFETADSAYLLHPFGTNSSGMVPIIASDGSLGQAFVKDVIKHFARVVIKRLWLHVDSLQPSTANNMMCVVAPSRGGGGLPQATFDVLATASEVGNTVANVSSMKGAFTVDSWESKCSEITDFIAGGSGARQNEFDVQTAIASGSNAGSVIVPGSYTDADGDGLVPACFTVAGNNTTSGLQNTKVHQISVELEIDLLDYVGGMAATNPIQ